MAESKLPLQPLFADPELNGQPRFRANTLVRWMLGQLKAKGITLDDFPFDLVPQADLDQFYTLIGYSLSGYEELSFISDEAIARAKEAWIDSSSPIALDRRED